MPRFIQRICLVCCLLLAARSGFAFSLLGEVEAWQVPAIGHFEPGDIGGVKNLGEGYRWNVPVITYGFDNSFLSYFGSGGVAAVDAAFAILNSLPPVSTMDNMEEFPLIDPVTGAPTTFRDSRRENPRARANNLLDMKSFVLGYVLEQLGLAEPERFTWTLRERRTEADPPETNYLVIMRNFDPVSITPSAYVNGTRYTFQILEDNQANADAFEIPVDPEFAFSSVALRSLSFGTFFTYLTRDDIGGLRYLYHPTNRVWEPFPVGTESFVPDFTNPILLTNLDLTLFSLLSRTVSPATLSNLYPGLLITGATPSGSIIVSNVPVVVTNNVPLFFFTNNAAPLILTNLDLSSFASFTRTNDPAAVLAAFPTLLLASTNAYPTTVVAIASIDFTNAPPEPWDDPFNFRPMFVTNFVTNAAINYFYTFRNVFTNYFGPLTVLRTEITGVQKEPWSDALNPIYRTNTQDRLVAEPSGGVVIVPTNLLGYDIVTPVATNVVGITNILFQTNVLDPSTGLARLVQELEIRFFTNVSYFAYPIELLAQGQFTNVVITNGFTTNLVTTYNITVGNVLTNYFGPTTPGTRYRFSVTPSPLNPAVLITNIISQGPDVLPVPSGGFLIDTNLTGFLFVATNFPTVIQVTNVVFDVLNPATGERQAEVFVYNFTNTVYQVFGYVTQPAPAQLLRGGVDKIQFVRLGDGTIQGNVFNFTNRYQVTFWTNGLPVREAFQIVQTRPDILFIAADIGTTLGLPFPLGVQRNSGFQNNAAINTQGDPADQGGPGTIFPPINIALNKIGPSLLNTFPGFTTEASVRQLFGIGGVTWVWGSFDGSTNPPIVFPQDQTSLEELEARTAGNQIE